MKNSSRKKKVAFCLRGAVSKRIMFSRKNTLYSNDKYCDYVKCRNSIFKYIVEQNPHYEIDFFCHCWNLDLKDSLKSLYNPKNILVEDNNIYTDEIEKKCKKDTDFGGISQALTIKKSIMLKEKYEKKHGFKYDIVILYRYDVLLWKKLLFDNYKLSNYNIYVNAHPNSNGDFHFIMKNDISIQFKNLYDSVEKGNYHATHHWIKNFIIKYCKKNIVMDNIFPGKHQEVIRKVYNFSILPGYLSQELYDKL